MAGREWGRWAVSAFTTLGLLIGLEALARRAEQAAETAAAPRPSPAVRNTPSLQSLVHWLEPGLAEPDDALGFRLRPGAQTAHYQINAQGFRGPEADPVKPAGTYRIVTLGGSTTFGWGVAETETYSRLLEAQLKAACVPSLAGRIEVLNGGVPGYTSGQDLAALEARWLAYQPDLILVMTGLNDVIVAVANGPGDARDPLGRLRLPAHRPTALQAWGAWAYREGMVHSALVRWCDRLAGRRALWPAAIPLERNDPSLPAHLGTLHGVHEHLDGMWRLTEARGIRLVVLGHPGVQRGPQAEALDQIQKEYHKVYAQQTSAFAGTLDRMHEEYRAVFALMAAWARRRQVDFLDLSKPLSAFEARAVFQPDGVHFTALGNAQVAEAIAQRLSASGCSP